VSFVQSGISPGKDTLFRYLSRPFSGRISHSRARSFFYLEAAPILADHGAFPSLQERAAPQRVRFFFKDFREPMDPAFP